MAGHANALTLYKCILLDGGGVIYQEAPPSVSECLIEKKDLNPDANVIPAEDFIGGREPEVPTGSEPDSPAAAEQRSVIGQ